MVRTPASSSASYVLLGPVPALTAVTQHPVDATPKRHPPTRATRWRARSPAPRLTSAPDFRRLDEPGRRQASGRSVGKPGR